MDLTRVAGWAAGIDDRLAALGNHERAEHERHYLKSDLTHYGVSVPATRRVAREFSRTHDDMDREELVSLVERLWTAGVHELRMIAVELLDMRNDLLVPGDIELLERLIDESGTWALVDGLAASVTGRLIERQPAVADELDEWVSHESFWVRRAALLALLVPLRRGDGDWERFTRYADALLEERQFFIRKAIGWVLRDTARRRPAMVYEWLLPRVERASRLTVREAARALPENLRTRLLERLPARAGKDRAS